MILGPYFPDQADRLESVRSRARRRVTPSAAASQVNFKGHGPVLLYAIEAVQRQGSLDPQKGRTLDLRF